MNVKRGDYVQFRSDSNTHPAMNRLGRIYRVAKDGSWADVETKRGGKRIPDPYENLHVVKSSELIKMYI